MVYKFFLYGGLLPLLLKIFFFKRLQMLLRVTPLIQNILQPPYFDSRWKDNCSRAHHTIYVPAVNMDLSTINHALREKMLKPIALSFVVT